jgi:hypothetical protein
LPYLFSSGYVSVGEASAAATGEQLETLFTEAKRLLKDETGAHASYVLFKSCADKLNYLLEQYNMHTEEVTMSLNLLLCI